MSLESHYSAYHRKTVQCCCSFFLTCNDEAKKTLHFPFKYAAFKYNANDSPPLLDIYIFSSSQPSQYVKLI